MFKEIFKKSFAVTVRRPYLWIFGIFSSFIFNFNAEINFIGKLLNKFFGDNLTIEQNRFIQNTIDAFLKLKINKPGAFFGFTGFLLIILLLGAIFAYISISSICALIHSLKEEYVNKKNIGFKNSFKNGSKYFLHILLTIIPVFAANLLFYFLIDSIGFENLTFGPQLTAGLILIIFATIFFVALMIVVRLAIIDKIFNNSRPLISFKNSLNFFLKNISKIFLFCIFIIIAEIIFFGAVLAVLLGISFPFLLIVVLFKTSVNFFWKLFLFWLVFLLIVISIIQGLLTAFLASLWINFYLKLKNRE